MTRRIYLVPPPAAAAGDPVAADPGGAATEPDPCAEALWVQSLCIVASIDNLAQIESAYGCTAALTVRHIVHERARQFCAEHAAVVTFSGSHLLFVCKWDSAPDMPGDPPSDDDPCAEQRLVERVIAALGACCVQTASAAIIPVISASIPAPDVPCFDLEEVSARADREGSNRWRSGYLADMQLAEQLLGAMERNELGFRYEKICDPHDPRHVSYYEALLCRKDEGAPISTANQLGALERLGLVSRLDKWVVTAVIGTLRSHKHVSLGCNVSIQSASLEGWWSMIAGELAKEPEVAARLVVEVSEAISLTDTEALRDFVGVLQVLGCRVALDDVGAGCSRVQSLSELGVDIAKVDRSYLAHARSNELARVRFKSLLGFARTCASHVVVAGIDCDEDLELSRVCGALWIQGALFEPLDEADLESQSIAPRGDR
jgi:EAL domain-containing protein (putative c-di-GMP-specific phosphodiesterase class I)